MPELDSRGVRLHYAVAGDRAGRPTVLVHGFASDYRLNWVGTRWEAALAAAGRLVLGLDCRGHGASQKPHQPAAYSRSLMAADVLGLLDHLDLAEADLVGYSMGAQIGLEAALGWPDRLGRAVLGGIGIPRPGGWADPIAGRLRGDTRVRNPVAQLFYDFASARPGNDLEALACCILGLQEPFDSDRLRGLEVPVLVAAGDRDQLARGASELAAALPGARFEAIAGRDHMSAVPARQFKEAALSFLAEPVW